MGFGFVGFFIFILVPLTGILMLAWFFTRDNLIGKILGFVWLGVFGLILLFGVLRWLTSKTVLDKHDYYGEYVINREYFAGEQTDWQYNHFRFEITESDSIYFYLTDRERILKTYRGVIKSTESKDYHSERLRIEMDQPTHHIMVSNPTTYRSSWDFYLVFESAKFYNVFFKKGKWKSID